MMQLEIELEKYRKKRQVFFVLNTIIVIAIMAVSGLNIYIVSQFENNLVDVIFGAISCVFGLMTLILGVLLPSKEKAVYLSDGTKETIAALNYVLNDRVTSPSVMERNPLYRSWSFPGMMILSIFMIIFNSAGVMLAGINGYSPATNIALIALWVLLDVCSAFWTYYDVICCDIDEGSSLTPKECGKRGIRIVVRSIIIAIVVLAVIAVVSYFMAGDQYKPIVDTEQLNTEVNDALDKLNQLGPEGFFLQDEYENVGEAILGLKGNFGDSKYYYILKYAADSSTLNIVSWSDDYDSVFIDSFDCFEDGSLSRTMSFISDALTKADVEGKQDGFVE